MPGHAGHLTRPGLVLVLVGALVVILALYNADFSTDQEDLPTVGHDAFDRNIIGITAETSPERGYTDSVGQTHVLAGLHGVNDSNDDHGLEKRALSYADAISKGQNNLLVTAQADLSQQVPAQVVLLTDSVPVLRLSPPCLPLPCTARTFAFQNQ